MAVNGIRVSALPEMMATDLTKDDYLIVNDANTNTRRINYDEFLKSINADVADELDVVISVNGISGVVSLDAADVGAPSVVDFQELETRTNAAANVAASNLTEIVALKSDIGTVPDGTDLQTQVTTNATDISALTASLSSTDDSIGIGDSDTLAAAKAYTDTGVADTLAAAKAYTDTEVADTLAATVVNDDVVLADAKAYTENAITGTATFEQGAKADTALQDEDLLPYSTTDQANELYALKGTGTNSIDGNADDIAKLANGTTNLELPSVNGDTVTATGTELNQLDGVTLGTAASAAVGDFATAAQGELADLALQSVPAEYSTKLAADALYAPIAVTGADGDAAKAAVDAAFGVGADLKVNYAVGELDTEDKIVVAINATNTKINALITALQIS